MLSHTITTKQNRLTALRCVLIFLGLSCDGEAIELKSSRQAWQIISALNAALDSSFTARGLGYSKREFIGCAEGKDFQVYCSSQGKNTWRPVLRGKVLDKEGGSLIEAHFDIHDLAKMASLIWIIVVSSTAYSFLSIDKYTACHLFAMAFAVGPIAFFVGFIVRGERKKLLALLESVARESN